MEAQINVKHFFSEKLIVMALGRDRKLILPTILSSTKAKEN